MLKLLFQKLQIRPILALGRDSGPPGAPLKITTQGTSGGIWTIVFQGETDHRPTLGTANFPGNTAVFCFVLFLSNFP